MVVVVTLATCTRAVATIVTGNWFPLQLAKPRYERNRDVALDPKALGSAAVGWMIDNAGVRGMGVPGIVMQNPSEV